MMKQEKENEVIDPTADLGNDVYQGLSADPKFLPSKYFYDEEGDRLFQEIMRLPEYYLTRAEYDIMQNSCESLLHDFSPDGAPFHLIELGAGDGTKTKVLLEHFTYRDANFIYKPVDISANVLQLLESDLSVRFPKLKVRAFHEDYFSALERINLENKSRKVVLFMGGNIGNFKRDEAADFLRKLRLSLNPGDLLLTGFDLKKDPDRILKAYDDPAGITRKFNMNLLTRINRELDADFNEDAFMHYPTYDPVSGVTKSFLVSRKEQEVRLSKINLTVSLDAWEAIQTEVSVKYSLPEISALAQSAGFRLVKNYFDSGRNFTDSLWEI